MCGRFYRRSDRKKVIESFHVEETDGAIFEPNYNIAPTTFQPVIRLDRERHVRELLLMRWGLVPHFAKSLADFKGFSTINARAETVATAATWRTPFKKRRCLIPADGFFEWKKLDDSAKPAKQPYAITLTNAEPMAFAGLWDAWKEPTGVDWLQSFAIVTTEANEIMTPIHERMPVILRERDWDEWLSRDENRPPPTHLLRPYDAEAMQVALCNPLVGNVRNNGPEMLNTP